MWVRVSSVYGGEKCVGEGEHVVGKSEKCAYEGKQCVWS